jgi:AcrR family transcriptional regulator
MAMTEELGLRERKKRRTEQELQRVALELVRARGFDHVTTDDIAAAAEVSKTTFYRYFDSKEAVVLGKSADKLEQMRAALAERPESEPPLTAVRNAVLSMAEHFQIEREQRIEVGHLIHDTPALAMRNLEHHAAWQTVLAEYLAERLGEQPGDLRPRVLAANVTSTLRAAIDHWIDGDGKNDLPSVVADALQLRIDGVPDTGASGVTASRARRRGAGTSR